MTAHTVLWLGAPWPFSPAPPPPPSSPRRKKARKTMSNSKLLDLKRQIDELNAQLEATRAEEFDDQVADIKTRIEAYNIRPEHLFTKDELAGKEPTTPKRVRQPPKYHLNGHTWSGRGAPPAWYREAISAGKAAEDMLISKAQ